MANDIIKQLQAAACIPSGKNASNVLAFPQRTLSLSKPPRRGRKQKCTNVLNFTGKKIDNYDSKALRSEWQEGLLEEMAEMYARAVKGEFSGLMIVGAKRVPEDGSDPGFAYGLSGIYFTDLAFAARHAEWMGIEAEKLAVDRPARPL